MAFPKEWAALSLHQCTVFPWVRQSSFMRFMFGSFDLLLISSIYASDKSVQFSFLRCGFSESKSAALCSCPALCFIFLCYFTITTVYSYLHRAGVGHSSAALSPYISLHWSVFCLTYWWHWKVLCLLFQLQHNSVLVFCGGVSCCVLQPHRELRLLGS